MTPGGHLPGLLGPAAAIARAVWFVAWSVLAGAVAWSWAFGPPSPLTDARAGLVDRAWRRALRLGWMWSAEATLLCLVVALFAATTTATSVITGETGLGWGVLGVSLALLRQPVRRLSDGASAAGRALEQDRWATTWLLAPVAVGAVLSVPTHARVVEAVRVAIAAVHLASAGLWLGTVGLVVVVVRSASWRAEVAPGLPVRPFVRPIIETAGRAAFVLVVSGVAAAAVSSPGLWRWTTEYSGLLAAKAVVLVVAAGIAWRQWVVVHGRGALTRSLTATVVEAGALLTAAVLAAVLVGVDPLPAASAAASAPAPAPVSCITAHQNCDTATIDHAIAGSPDPSLDALLPTFCTADPARPHAYAYFTCLTALGQALAERDAGAPDPALAHCQALAEPWAQQSCGGGVFSQLVVGETAGSASSDPHRDDPVWPCDQVADGFKTPCYLLSTTRILWLNGGDVPAAFATCDQQPAGFRPTCYQSLGRDITSRGHPDPSSILQSCGSAGALGPGACIDGAARTLVFTSRTAEAAALCLGAPTADRAACETVRLAALGSI
jgi:hypothetical protein